MKITLEVPNGLPANFERPSLELLQFVDDLIKLYVFLAQYTDATGRHLFTGYVRNGANSVFSTHDNKTYNIQWGQEAKPYPEDIEEDEDPDEEVLTDLPENQVYMDPDLPGNWMVARMCAPGNIFINLRSQDFQGTNGEATAKLTHAVQALVEHRHTVPMLGLKLSTLLQTLDAD
jgi:hypothetical protein